MLTFHLIVSFAALAAGALVLFDWWSGGSRQSTLATILLGSTLLISITGLALPSPPGTPVPDPARVLSVIEIVVVAFAMLAFHSYKLAGGWRNIYAAAIVLAVYFNVFVAVTQAFLKISALHALAPTGKEPPFVIAQLVTLALFVAIGVGTLRHRPANLVKAAA